MRWYEHLDWALLAFIALCVLYGGINKMMGEFDGRRSGVQAEARND